VEEGLRALRCKVFLSALLIFTWRSKICSCDFYSSGRKSERAGNSPEKSVFSAFWWRNKNQKSVAKFYALVFPLCF